MKQGKKDTKNQKAANRYFFTAPDDLANFIEKQAENMGLQAPEFIRMKMYGIMKESHQSDA